MITRRSELPRRIALRLVIWGTGVNAAGAALVFVFLQLVFRRGDEGPGVEINLILVAAYTAGAAVAVWHRIGEMRRGLAQWAASDRPAGPRERDLVLRQPARGMTFQAAAWTLAAVLFGVLNAEGSVRDGLEVAGSIALGGLVTSAAVFLVTERVMRPAVALVLSSSPPPEAGALGVGPRILLTWLLVAGAPLIAIALLAAADEPRDPAGAIAFVVGVALVVGAATVTLAARAVSERIRAVRSAMDAVAEGDLLAAVTVDDARRASASSSFSTTSSPPSSRWWNATAGWSTSSRAMPRCASSGRPWTSPTMLPQRSRQHASFTRDWPRCEPTPGSKPRSASRRAKLWPATSEPSPASSTPRSATRSTRPHA